MAYITQETKKQLTPAIKAALAAHGLKGSIAIRNNSVLVVKVKADKITDKARQDITQAMTAQTWYDASDVQSDYCDVAYYRQINLQRNDFASFC